jgi:hypothetical protein
VVLNTGPIHDVVVEGRELDADTLANGKLFIDMSKETALHRGTHRHLQDQGDHAENMNFGSLGL